MVGGQRRRNTRRSNAPRSNTTPNLGLDSLAGRENASGVTAAQHTDQVEHSHVSPPSAPSNPMVNSYAHNSGPPGDRHRPLPARPSDGFSTMPAAHSPTPTTGSASTAATEGKKRHGKFGRKAKDQDRPSSSHEPTPQLSPLPPLTPIKAALLLGVDPGPSPGRPRSTSVGRPAQNDGGYDSLPIRPISTRRGSMSAITTQKSASDRQTRFTEEGLDTEPAKPKGFWGNTNRKAQRMLGLLPSAPSNASREADMGRVAAVSLAWRPEEHTDTYRSSDAERHGQFRSLPPVPPVVPEARRRRMRKKLPKELERMAPITETSHDELRTSYKISEHDPELNDISEYAKAPSKAPLSRSESLLTTDIRYELEEDDLSLTDEVIDEATHDEQDDFAAHPGSEVDVKNGAILQSTVFRLRGPLQTVEDRLLDEAETRLALSKAVLDQNDDDRLTLDTTYATLKASNEAMKADFAAAQRCHAAPGECELCGGADSQVDSEDEDDLDEEPTLHDATTVPFMRVTPGMVKLVDIAPKRKKSAVPLAPPAPPTRVAPDAPPNPLPLLALSSQLKAPFKPTYYFQHDEKISPFNERSEHVEVRKYLSTTTDATNKFQPTVMRGPLSASEFSRLDKDKRVKLPRDESRLLVQDWMSDYDHTKQRPLSERLDLDVLADQQIPPAPFPKEDYATPPLPPSSSSKEHYCLKNGHIFHPINLKTVPDEVAINSLEVRPYLHTAVGFKQHVSVPVFCDRCNEDVKEELWECDIHVCRMGVCKQCAEDMEHEWQERVADAWTR
ncbi:uncharacterized protein J4E84_001201 [Alternaria hordeiaustralica]|uniref:uncharacterized protein n=1 Tax=Alternaria hordeiaustralica TaxID=1187925 RepID=UPI0020C47280|nr:uncharacterized protein J4E84_001201 [Alternaria hordeiaustralica]KAI4698067.1 hypothetical protein J4E84_001201 [Alternaria hordeiaustralica]